MLDNFSRVVRLFDLAPLVYQFKLFLSEHLSASLIEFVSLLQVFLGLLRRELIENILLAGLLRNNLDVEGLLHFEHVFHEALVAILAIERMAPRPA